MNAGVAITGIGVVSPFGRGVRRLESGLAEGRSCLEETRIFAPQLGFVPVAARVTEPLDETEVPGFRPSRTDRLALTAAREAVSGEALASAGVVMATTVGGLPEVQPRDVIEPGECGRRGRLAALSAYQNGHAADVVAAALGLRGPRLGVSVACASGAMAIALAARMILDGSAPVMLAGGSDALCEFTLSGFHSLRALDPEPCRPFDVNRKGLNIGEGAAVLVLEDLGRARERGRRIWAVLRGWAMTNDAFHPTAPHEAGCGLAASVLGAARMAGVSPDEIGYVNAHGTGTPANDIAETRAYETAFGSRSRPIPVSSTKSYMGHTLGAAGALEAAAAILSLRSGVLVPTLRLRQPIESERVEYFSEPRRESMRLVLSASAGFGGSNTSLLFGEDG